jgi:hypothetical protein
MQPVGTHLPRPSRCRLRWANDAAIPIVQIQLIIKIDNNLLVKIAVRDTLRIGRRQSVKYAKILGKTRRFRVLVSLCKSDQTVVNR